MRDQRQKVCVILGANHELPDLSNLKKQKQNETRQNTARFRGDVNGLVFQSSHGRPRMALSHSQGTVDDLSDC